MEYEGEYLNDLKNGIGKEYNIEGELIFEGEYLNNKKMKGQAYKSNILEYKGEYLNDRKWNGKVMIKMEI